MAKQHYFWVVSFLVFLVTAGLIVYLVIIEINKNIPNTPSYPNRPHHRKQSIGGCLGTRYGCCPGSSISKTDSTGSNCFY